MPCPSRTPLYNLPKEDLLAMERDGRAVQPQLQVGDVLIFDGLLVHRGMENRTEGELCDGRFFYYTVLALTGDANTDVTGS